MIFLGAILGYIIAGIGIYFMETKIDDINIRIFICGATIVAGMVSLLLLTAGLS